MRSSVFATFGTWHLSVREYLFTIAELNLVAGLSDPNASRLLQYEISANSALLLRPCNTFLSLSLPLAGVVSPKAPFALSVVRTVGASGTGKIMMKIHRIY